MAQEVPDGGSHLADPGLLSTCAKPGGQSRCSGVCWDLSLELKLPVHKPGLQGAWDTTSDCGLPFPDYDTLRASVREGGPHGLGLETWAQEACSAKPLWGKAWAMWV